MRRQSGIVFFAVFALVTTLLGESPAHGLTLRPASWRELRELSDCVIRATVVSMHSEKSDEPGARGIQTRMKFENAALLSGKNLPGDFAVLLPGGELNGRCVRVPGAPQFIPGEHVILFLRELAPGEYALCGHGLGVLRESADRTHVRPDCPVREGTPREGEEFSTFLTRLSVNSEKTGASSATFPGVLGIVALLACVAAVFALRRRAPRGSTALVVAVLLAGGIVYVSRLQAAPVAPREFQLEGVRWFLQKQRPGQVENGRVLWVRGTGTTHQSDADTFAVIAAQFQQWEDVPGSAIAFLQTGQTAESGTAINGRNLVSFLQRPPRTAFDSLTLAITFIQPIKGTDEIEDADIVFNDRDVDWELAVGDFSISAVALHEIGHFLGLDHTSDPATVMFPTAGGLTQLSPGDLAGASFIYPVQEALPVAVASASPQHGAAPLDVSFSSDGSRLLDGSVPVLQWDFGDGTPPSNEAAPVHTYSVPGVYTVRFSVSNASGVTTSLSGLIVVENAESTLAVSKFSFAASLLTQARGTDKVALTMTGAAFSPGDRLRFQIGRTAIGTLTADGVLAPMELDDTLKFTGDVNVGGTGKLSFTANKGVLSLAVSAAKIGRALDLRAAGNSALTGSATVPIQLVVERHTGATDVFTADVPVSFSIRSGRTPFGFLERSIQGKR